VKCSKLQKEISESENSLKDGDMVDKDISVIEVLESAFAGDSESPENNITAKTITEGRTDTENFKEGEHESESVKEEQGEERVAGAATVEYLFNLGAKCFKK
jgi:hypothetical protein